VFDFAAHAVHRHGKRGVRFDRNRAVRHRAGRETLDDLGGGLDFFDRNGFYVAEANSNSPRKVMCRFGLVVDDGGVFPVGLRGVLPRRLLQFRDRVRRPHVLLARTRQAYSPPASSIDFSTGSSSSNAALWMRIASFGNLENIYAPIDEVVPVKYLSTSDPAEPTASKICAAGVGHVGGNAHLGHHFFKPLPIALTKFLMAFLPSISVPK